MNRGRITRLDDDCNPVGEPWTGDVAFNPATFVAAIDTVREVFEAIGEMTRTFVAEFEATGRLLAILAPEVLFDYAVERSGITRRDIRHLDVDDHVIVIRTNNWRTIRLPYPKEQR